VLGSKLLSSRIGDGWEKSSAILQVIENAGKAAHAQLTAQPTKGKVCILKDFLSWVLQPYAIPGLSSIREAFKLK